MIDRIAKFLDKHPREPLLLIRSGKFYLVSAFFGEEAPEPTFEARADAIREWESEHLVRSAGIYDQPISDDMIRDLLDRLADVNANVMAGGAIHGCDDDLGKALDHALGEARC